MEPESHSGLSAQEAAAGSRCLSRLQEIFQSTSGREERSASMNTENWLMSRDLSFSTRAAGARKAVASKAPNAIKHGAFSSIDPLPWESAEEFAALRRALFDKYNPDGPLQENCMASISREINTDPVKF